MIRDPHEKLLKNFSRCHELPKLPKETYKIWVPRKSNMVLHYESVRTPNAKVKRTIYIEKLLLPRNVRIFSANMVKR